MVELRLPEPLWSLGPLEELVAARQKCGRKLERLDRKLWRPQICVLDPLFAVAAVLVGIPVLSKDLELCLRLWPEHQAGLAADTAPELGQILIVLLSDLPLALQSIGRVFDDLRACVENLPDHPKPKAGPAEVSLEQLLSGGL